VQESLTRGRIIPNVGDRQLVLANLSPSVRPVRPARAQATGRVRSEARRRLRCPDPLSSAGAASSGRVHIRFARGPGSCRCHAFSDSVGTLAYLRRAFPAEMRIKRYLRHLPISWVTFRVTIGSLPTSQTAYHRYLRPCSSFVDRRSVCISFSRRFAGPWKRSPVSTSSISMMRPPRRPTGPIA
jgi:hypothetical protein